MSTAVAAIRRKTLVVEWTAFIVQVLIAISLEIADDLGRGVISQHGTMEGIRNAKSVVAFEAAHGFWVEPAWQSFFLHTRHILTFTVTWMDVAHVMNTIYVFGHIFFTLGVALWVFFWRRKYFRFLRNAVILINGFALVVYESFPVAPPRMTTGLRFDHRHFHFIDTLYGVINGGKVVGTQVGYNEFSAMPSVHIAWALIAAAAVVWLARPWSVKVLAAVYPVLMLLAVVVTGNHFLLDAFAAVGIVIVAAATAASFEVWRGRFTLSRASRAPAAT